MLSRLALLRAGDRSGAPTDIACQDLLGTTAQNGRGRAGADIAAAALWTTAALRKTAALWKTRPWLKNLLQLAIEAGPTQDIVPVAGPRTFERLSTVERGSERGPKE